MPLNFIHAADFHLGADLRRFGSAEIITILQAAQFNALEKTLALAIERKAAFVAICGDLFDSRFPKPVIIDRTRDLLARFSAIKILILPGTHDYLSDNSILTESRSDIWPENVVIINESIQCPFTIPQSECNIFFRPNKSNRSAFSPLAELKPPDSKGINIALAHGSLKSGGVAECDFPIDPREVEKSGFDYIALGHWHKPGLENYGSVVVAYSGTAQPISYSDPETGSVNLVSIDDSGVVSVERIMTSTVSFKSISEKIYHPRQLSKLLEKVANPASILKIDLEYSDNCKEYAEIKTIVENARSRFLLINSDSSNSRKSMSRPNWDVREESNLLIDSFLAELDRIKAIDSPQRAGLYEKAADLGLRIIRGEV